MDVSHGAVNLELTSTLAMRTPEGWTARREIQDLLHLGTNSPCLTSKEPLIKASCVPRQGKKKKKTFNCAREPFVVRSGV